jgi:hypothetical protein
MDNGVRSAVVQPQTSGSATADAGRRGIFGALLNAVRRWVFHCPHCVNHRLRRSRARGRERWLGLLLFRSYRCHGCCRRFWRPRIGI